MVRSIDVGDCVELQKRVDKIAEGAALMTETKCKKKFIDGLANVVPNKVLGKVVHANMSDVIDFSYTAQEYEFAASMAKTYAGSDVVTGIGTSASDEYKDSIVALKTPGKYLNDFVTPLFDGYYAMPSSTDVGGGMFPGFVLQFPVIFVRVQTILPVTVGKTSLFQECQLDLRVC